MAMDCRHTVVIHQSFVETILMCGQLWTNRGPQYYMAGWSTVLCGRSTVLMVGPQYLMVGPQNYMGSPQHYMGGPQCYMGSPQCYMAGPQYHMAGPQYYMSGPQLWIDHCQLTTAFNCQSMDRRHTVVIISPLWIYYTHVGAIVY